MKKALSELKVALKAVCSSKEFNHMDSSSMSKLLWVHQDIAKNNGKMTDKILYRLGRYIKDMQSNIDALQSRYIVTPSALDRYNDAFARAERLVAAHQAYNSAVEAPQQASKVRSSIARFFPQKIPHSSARCVPVANDSTDASLTAPLLVDRGIVQ